jgi:nucleotidyltransferase/DNA polymerase involved in DNA repair
MEPLTLESFSRAIVHIDGDAFFASCEQSRRPKLQGRPVVTGKERNIAASMSYEAKAAGVTRGMPLAEIRKICPDAVILPSDYETYSLLSKRFFAIVQRYTPDVEDYSIDECFADLTGLQGRVPVGCGQCFGTSPDPSVSCESVGHQHSQRVFNPSAKPLDQYMSARPLLTFTLITGRRFLDRLRLRP